MNKNKNKGAIPFTPIMGIVVAMVVLAMVVWFFWEPPTSGTGQNKLNGYIPNGKNSQTAEKSLNLNGQGLTQIPSYVFSQASLEVLDVSFNNIGGAIQAEIRNLQNLKILNASNNKMTGVPAEIGQLQNLKILNLSNNQLTGLPYELGNLQNLSTLDISGNSYSEQDLNIIRQNLPDTVNIITE